MVGVLAEVVESGIVVVGVGVTLGRFSVVLLAKFIPYKMMAPRIIPIMMAIETSFLMGLPKE